MLHDPDTYLHIAAGNWMLAHHALPTADPFSFTVAGATWVPHEWLAEIILAVTYATTAWGGVAVLTALCFALAMALLMRFLRDLDPFAALLLVILSAGLMMPHLLARPHLLALPAMVAWCGGIIAARDAGRAPPWSLLPVMVLWANLHDSFMFGLALTAYLGAEAVVWPADSENRRVTMRRWALFVAAAVLASLATPNGLAGLLQPLRLVTMPELQRSFIEWQAPRLPDAPILELWVLGAVAAGLGLSLRLPLPRLVLICGLLYLAVGHARHADLLAATGPLVIAASLAPQIAQHMRSLPLPTVSTVFARLSESTAPPAMALAAVAALLICVPVLVRPLDRAGDFSTPAAALQAAEKAGLTGPIFNEQGYGGYLIFSGVPVFIDGRIELYGNDFLGRYLAAHNGKQPELSQLLDRYGIQWTLLSPDAGAVAQLDRMTGWRRLYTDRQAVIHVRVN